jgi:pimeloyl-ACP methyl ester carboxylesterase
MAGMVIDYNAAIDYMKSRGYSNIALYGHSIGGARVLYYAAHNPDPAVKAIITSAGPTFNEASYLASPRKDEFLAAKAQALALVDAGRGRDLVTFNFPAAKAILCADSWLGTYCSSDYDVAFWAHNIKLPILRIECGDETPERRLLIDGVSETLFGAAPHPANKFVMIEGADHHFTRKFPEACREVVLWLDGLPA